MVLPDDSTSHLRAGIIANAAKIYPELIQAYKTQAGKDEINPAEVFAVQIAPQNADLDGIVSLVGVNNNIVYISVQTGELHSIKTALRALYALTAAMVNPNQKPEKKVAAYNDDDDDGPTTPSPTQPRDRPIIGHSPYEVDGDTRDLRFYREGVSVPSSPPVGPLPLSPTRSFTFPPPSMRRASEVPSTTRPLVQSPSLPSRAFRALKGKASMGNFSSRLRNVDNVSGGDAAREAGKYRRV